MAKATANSRWQQSDMLLSGTVITTIVIVALYWAQIVFVPLALSIMFVFLLTPPVRWLERRGLGRPLSVAIVVLVCLFVLGELAYLVGQQMSALAVELPDYSANIRTKIESVRNTSTGFERFQAMIEEITATMAPATPTPENAVVMRPESQWLSRWPSFLGTAVEVLACAALVFVLTIFGLFKREDLRNRFLRLIGHRRVAYTTKAVDEAGERLSRYLLIQAVVNLAYGAVLALGLGIVGVRYALLWGAIAVLLRYIPYIGAWLTMIFPLAVSIATAETWFQPIAALAVFFVLEMVTYNVIEPTLFKRSMGVSEVAQLVSAAFWGFLWGPVGLVLSVPLTVCLLVVGKYVPRFSFLDVLLGDDPPLEAPVSFYQRLLARDEDDASTLVNEQMKKSTPIEVLDELLMPALSYVKRDRQKDEITEDDEEFVLQATREIVDDVAPDAATPVVSSRPVKVLGCPAFDGADGLALEMLSKSVKLGGLDRFVFEMARTDSLTAEVVQQAAAEQADLIVCIGSVLPGGLAHTRYLCKRLRQRLPKVKILVGRWGRRTSDESDQQLIEAGADAVTASLQASRLQLQAWLALFARSEVNEVNQTAPTASGIDPKGASPTPKLAIV